MHIYRLIWKFSFAFLFMVVRLNKSIYEPHISRTIFMVIDALRTDFIQNNGNASLQYVNQLLASQSACLNNIEVENPTVTMPRIKVIWLRINHTQKITQYNPSTNRIFFLNRKRQSQLEQYQTLLMSY